MIIKTTTCCSVIHPFKSSRPIVFTVKSSSYRQTYVKETDLCWACLQFAAVSGILRDLNLMIIFKSLKIKYMYRVILPKVVKKWYVLSIFSYCLACWWRLASFLPPSAVVQLRCRWLRSLASSFRHALVWALLITDDEMLTAFHVEWVKDVDWIWIDYCIPERDWHTYCYIHRYVQ